MRTPTRVRKTLNLRALPSFLSHRLATRPWLHKNPRSALVVARHDLRGSTACCLPLSASTSVLACAHSE